MESDPLLPQHEISEQGNDELTADKFIFSEEEIENISALVTVLKQVRARLLKENVDLDYYRKLLGIAVPNDKPEKSS